MFIAHIPAGYLTAASAQRLGLWSRGLMLACMAGANAPDVDLVYAYLVDGGTVHHHLYWTHFPVVWLLLLLASVAACVATRCRRWAVLATFFTGCALVHLALDGLAGDIPLLAPWDMRFYSCVTVHAHYEPWWLNFLLHWTMLVELGIVVAAGIVFTRRRIRRARRLYARLH